MRHHKLTAARNQYSCRLGNNHYTSMLEWSWLDGFIGYPKGRNVERALGFSLTGTVSTSPNLAKARARRASNGCRATRSSLAKFGEVDTVPVSEEPTALSTFRPLGYPIKP